MSSYAIDQSRCTFCGGCSSVCPAMAIEVHDDRTVVTGKCSGCGTCERFCPVGAVALSPGLPAAGQRAQERGAPAKGTGA